MKTREDLVQAWREAREALKAYDDNAKLSEDSEKRIVENGGSE